MTQKQSARKFVEYWTFQRGSEKGEDQQFWNSLLGEVLGLEDVKSHVQYQVPVPMKGTTKFLDAWIPETRVLIEHKSRGVNLDAPQAGHNGLAPYEQAVEYDNARSYEDKARWIVTCNFDAIWIYDRSRPLEEPQKITLSELPKEVHRLAFLVKRDVQKVDSKELEISVQAGRIVAKLYDALLKQFGSDAPETLAALNRLCVRLVFCLYAEDTDIFPKNALRNLIKSTPVEFMRRQLLRLFQTLDTPPEKRDRYLEAELAIFPYTNGGLFAGASESEIPPLTDEIVKLLDGSSGFDWSGISPTIFGALFESTLNPQTRRAGGMVYTSVENIHKVIDPLFMDGLTARVDELLGVGESKSRVEVEQRTGNNSAVGLGLQTSTKKKLFALQDEMASLTFLDPACGSGNFLTETYLSMRRLENRIIAALQGGQSEFDLGEGIGAKVSIHQFKGIEINDFAVSVAKTAMWIAEAKMHAETCEILHSEPDFLPLKEYDGIVQGNALRTDWGRLESKSRVEVEQRTDNNSTVGLGLKTSTYDYIMGNPPFVGARQKSQEQAADVEATFGSKWKGLGNLDYVTCWYKKAAELALAAKDAKNTKVAFVSTNSICQGDSVATLWKPLFESGVEIDFAYRTFRWDSEAHEKAHVHCVIVGFHVGDKGESKSKVEVEVKKETMGNAHSIVRLGLQTSTKTIYDSDGTPIAAEHINGYLMDGPDVWVESRTKPICDVPPLVFGSMPNDGGFLSDWDDEQKSAIVEKYPASEPLFRRFLGATEFLNNQVRWCLWLKNASPSAIRAVPPVMESVSKVRDMRIASSRAGTRKLADTPTLFGEIRQPESGNYLLVPCHSSENREYVPLGYISSDVICSNANLMIPSATLYHFGVLTSSVHMAWMRIVAGRLKSDYRYSAAIVYNNFPWPEGLLSLRGDSEIRSSGDDSEKTPNLQNSQSPSNESNHSESLCLCVKNIPANLCDSLCSLRQKIESTAQSILDARALYPDSSLADLYDPLTMPIELRKAHAANDAAVMKAYGLAPHTSEPEIVAHLFRLYSEEVSL